MFIVRSGNPPRMSQTPSAATSMVTAVGPRPTFCCPDLSLAMRARYIGILGSVRTLVVLVALGALLLGGCDDDEKPLKAPGSTRATGNPPVPNERLPATAPALAARLTEVDDHLRRSIDAWLAGSPGAH